MSEERQLTQHLQWLDDLHGIVTDFAAREKELETGFQNRASVRARQLKSTSEEIDLNLHRNIEATNVTAEAETERIHALATARTARMLEAYKNTLRQVDEQAQNLKDKKRFKLQQTMLKATRKRDIDTEKAKDRLREFNKAMDVEDARIVSLKEKARKSFGAFPDLGHLLDGGQVDESAIDGEAHEEVQLEELRELLTQNDSDLEDFRRAFLPKFFKIFPVGLVMMGVVLLHAGLTFASYQLDWGEVIYKILAGTFIASLSIVAIMHSLGRKLTASVIGSAADVYAFAEHLSALGRVKADKRYEKRRAALDAEFKQAKETEDTDWADIQREVDEARKEYLEAVEQKRHRVHYKHENAVPRKVERLEHDRAVTVERLRSEAAAAKQELSERLKSNDGSEDGAYFDTWESMSAEWNDSVPNYTAAFASAIETAIAQSPEWNADLLAGWQPPTEYPPSISFGHLDVDMEHMCEGVPQDERLAIPGTPQFQIPLTISIPHEGGVLFEAGAERRAKAISSLNNIALRALSNMPAGRVNFTVIDPVGLGQNFAGMMNLADFDETLISSRIWTQSGQIEKRLAELNDHMEKVIQMYLRNEYQTITEYNEKAGNIAEKYHFVVVADFPNNFTDLAARRLINIASSGTRCGVYTLIHWDSRQQLPPDIMPDDLRDKNIHFRETGYGFVLNERLINGVTVHLDPPPPPEIEMEITKLIGQAGLDSNRVEVPFEHVAPAENEYWTHDTTDELRIAIGRTGATKLQYLSIGKGTCQHALIAGKTGSGKSTLFHVIITNLALTCSPEHVEFYLIDFKKGVEFKCYGATHLPHARVVAIESDREFGLSVLQRVDEELRRRGEMFREVGAQDIAGYKRAGGKEPVPRSLLMIDEFQEFFVEDDRVAQNASVLLDRIVRQGRAFGIHVILGSQTLGGAYTLARTTIGQMVIRIALQCNETDSYLILDDNNPAARLLSRPGEGVYNDSSGMLEGNSPFQTVWISDTERDEWLQRVHDQAAASDRIFQVPIVFEGNAPSDIAENNELAACLAAETVEARSPRLLWLGAPNSIKGPAAAKLQRQSGSNLLVIGQREEAAQALVMLSCISLAAQIPAGKARYLLIDGTPADTPERESMLNLTGALKSNVRHVKNSEIESVLIELTAEMNKRGEDEAAGESIFLIIHGLQRFKKLRYEEDFSFDDDAPAKPGAQLNDLICEGAGVGIHVIATIDTYNNLQRALSRKGISEFEMRVLFQMSANDSANLIDSAKAANLGMHRALYYNEQEGHMETFRPYALPEPAWMESAIESVNRLHA
ncbi:MAG: ATP-binding protein [Verrucomicrobiales bacterium]|nr:ATP-binding protein [Verrucomicrobiales bacterium]